MRVTPGPGWAAGCAVVRLGGDGSLPQLIKCPPAGSFPCGSPFRRAEEAPSTVIRAAQAGGEARLNRFVSGPEIDRRGTSLSGLDPCVYGKTVVPARPATPVEDGAAVCTASGAY